MDKMNNKIQFCFPSKFHSTCANKFLPWHLKGEERAVPRSSFGRPRLCLAWCPLVILRACCSYQLVPVDVVPWTSTTWPWLESGWLWIKKTWGLEEKKIKKHHGIQPTFQPKMIDEFQQIQRAPEGSRMDFWGSLGCRRDHRLDHQSRCRMGEETHGWGVAGFGGLLANIGDRCDLDVIFLSMGIPGS